MQVEEYMYAALLQVGESHETKWISYLIVKFPGVLEQSIPEELRGRLPGLREAAILRYQEENGMIHLCGLTFLLIYVCLFYCLYYAGPPKTSI